MSSEAHAIEIESISKAFPVYAQPHHRLLQMLSRRNKQRWYQEFVALRGVSFKVERGETLGIVGRNGSGKSTLLQIICGTQTPTSGQVNVNGRVAALLELGSGFNPEFTGRENVFLNGMVLGLSWGEIEQRFDSIAAFAEIGEFMERPVRTYSSGMYVRLAFAVAINVTPDILIVDEALSVGDEAFQRKCFARINRIREDGATVLFVSHSAGTIIELCDRVILLDKGEKLMDGAPKHVISRYHKLVYAPESKVSAIRQQMLLEDGLDGSVIDGAAVGGAEASERTDAEDEYFDPYLLPQSTVRYVSRGAMISDPTLTTLSGRRVNVLHTGREYIYSYHAGFEKSLHRVRFGMLIKAVSGFEIGGAITAVPDEAIEMVEAHQRMRIQFQFRCLVAPGVYFLNAGVVADLGDGDEFVDRHIDAAMFRVMPDPSRLATALVDLDVKPSIEMLTRNRMSEV